MSTALTKIELPSGDNFAFIPSRFRDDQVTLFNAMQNPMTLGEIRKDGPVSVVGIVGGTAEVPDEEGVVVVRPKTIFLLDDGKAVMSTSPIIRRAAMDLLMFMGDPESWKKPVKIVFALKQNGTKTINTIQMVK